MPAHLQKEIKIAGHLYDKRGIYQMVFSWKDEHGKRQRLSQSTGLPVKGNKKRAESLLSSARDELEKSLASETNPKEVLFADFMQDWLGQMRLAVAQKELKLTTFSGYQSNVEKRIVPYFRKLGTRLEKLEASDINDFYKEMQKRVKATTIVQYHHNICNALRRAEMYHVIKKVKCPKADAFHGKFLKQSEAIKLFEAVRGHRLELGVILGAFYGLRRGEVVGLKWDAIDFDANYITIEHTVTTTRVDGKAVILAADTTKTDSSHRSLPLVPEFRKKLLETKKEQDSLRSLCGKSYDNKDAAYVYTDVLGNRVKPEFLTKSFPLWMERNGFKRMRFHDLRHSCASLLLAAGVSLKQIQEWLGHSDFAITANTYAHLEYESKRVAANAMSWIRETSMGMASEEESEHEEQSTEKKIASLPLRVD